MKSAGSEEAQRSRTIPGSPVLASILRLGLFLAVVCFVAAALVLRSARADVKEAIWSVGSELMAFPGAPQEGVRHLRLNGLRVSFRTQTVNASLAEVLDHYETVCGPAIATQAARNDNAGYVACVAMSDDPPNLGTVANQLLTFSETGDLSKVGDPRYVLARRVSGTSEERTFLLTMWTESIFDLYSMLPRDGADAAGHDLVGMPRPPGSQRILSAWEERQPSGVLVYRVVGQSEAELLSFYRVRLPENGWTITERNPSKSIRIDGIHILSAEKGNRLVTVLSHPGEASRTVLTILVSEPS